MTNCPLCPSIPAAPRLAVQVVVYPPFPGKPGPYYQRRQKRWLRAHWQVRTLFAGSALSRLITQIMREE